MKLRGDLLLRQLEMQAEERSKIPTITPERIDQLKKEQREKEGITERKDIKPDSLIGGWVLYIIVMIGGLIFVDYIVLAVFATIYFFTWRHREIERANGRKYDD